MMKRLCFVFVAVMTTLLGYSSTCMAQGYGVSLYFRVQGTGSTITSFNWNQLYSSSYAFQDVYVSRNSSANTMDVMFFVSNLVPSSSGQRTMKFEVIYQTGPSEIFDLYIPESDIGGQVEGEGTSCTFTMNYSPVLTLKPPTKNCNTVSLETSSVCGNFVFEASQDISNPASWRTIKTVPGANYYGVIETLTAADLQNAGISNPYGNTWVRFKDDQPVSYPWAESYRAKRVSNMVQIDLDAPQPTVVPGTPVNAVCYGDANGSVTLDISSPVATSFLISADNTLTPQSPDYQVSVGAGVKNMTGLTAGAWKFTVENNDGDAIGHCNIDKVVPIGQPSAPVTIAIDSSKHNGYAISCYAGTDGTATAVASGGNGNYKDYSWSSGETSVSVSGKGKGSYTVSLTDIKGCPASKTFKLTSPPVLKATPTIPKPYNGYSVSCYDKTDGSASVTGSGGVGGTYGYSWSNGLTTATATGLGVNTYTVKVSDANGCESPAAQVVMTAPDTIDFTIGVITPLACAGDSTGILEAKPVATTIIGSPHYLWTSGETDATIRDKPTGTYTVKVSDDQGCSTTKSKTLDDPLGYTVELLPGSDYNGVPIKCYKGTNGKLITTVRNPAGVVAAPQDYTWYRNGAFAGSGTTLSSQDGLDEATYRIEITYGTGCKAYDQVYLDAPDELTVTVAATTLATFHGQPISCRDSTDANVKATVNNGGTGPYTYLWDNGKTTSLLSGVGAGVYTVTVKDVNGCPATNKITLDNPAAVVASISDLSNHTGYGVSCALSTDGTMTASGSGGTGVYTYSWSNAGRTTAVNGSLGKGIYTVTVSDNNGCHDQASETITEPPVLEASIGSYTDVACNGGSDGVISLAATGGAGDYEYSRNGTTWIEEAAFAGLAIGTYTLTVRDGNNCSASAVQKLIQPPALALGFKDIEPAFCADPRGAATADVSGGVTGYTYSWTNVQGDVVSTAMRLTNARGGIYTVTIHDAHNCPITDKVGITSTDGAQVDYTATAALCHDSSDGSAMLSVAGDGPFVIEWPDGQSTLTGVSLKGGDYIVSVTDGHDCTVIEEVTVPAPEALGLDVASFTAPTCNGDCDGALTLVARGGTGTYDYTWNNQHGVSQTGLCKGTYAVVLTDVNNCRLEQPVVLNEPDVLTLKTESSTLATCTDGCDGKLTVVGAGGNGGYAYSWDGGIDGSGRSNLCPGDYSVMVTDVKGCVGGAVVTLANTPPVRVDLGGGVTLCVGQTYSLDAGTGWKTVQWSGNGLSSNVQVVTIKDPGSYWLDVVDSKGCVGRDTFLLETSYDLLQASFMVPAEAAVGDTVAIVDISWPLPESVEWSLPLEMKRISGGEDMVFGQFNTAGTYAVGLKAHLGECVDYVEKSIVILEGEFDDTDGRLGYEEYVKAFGLYANPNDGSFDVIVELADADDIMLSVWNGQTGALVGKVSERGNASYSVHVDLRPLSAGAYVLRLDHGKGSSYLRFIVR